MTEYILLDMFIVVCCWTYIILCIVTSPRFDDFIFYSGLILRFAFVVVCWLAMFGTHSFYIQWTINDRTYDVILNSIYN